MNVNKVRRDGLKTLQYQRGGSLPSRLHREGLRFDRSLRTKSVKRSGMKSGVTTSSAAPVSERFLTVQSIPPPPNSIVPAFNMRRRWATRCSSMTVTFDGDAAMPLEAR
jgi:hypothetical protein